MQCRGSDALVDRIKNDNLTCLSSIGPRLKVRHEPIVKLLDFQPRTYAASTK
jgi:hypothetical protein